MPLAPSEVALPNLLLNRRHYASAGVSEDRLADPKVRSFLLFLRRNGPSAEVVAKARDGRRHAVLPAAWLTRFDCG